MGSKGIRRLSISLGSLGLLGWISLLVFMFYAVETGIIKGEFSKQDWLIAFAGLLTSFFLPFWVTRGIAWAVGSFIVAKRECPFCKKKVKENEIICVHCKSELPPLPPKTCTSELLPVPPKKWYKNIERLLPIYLVLFASVALAAFATLYTSPESRRRQNRERERDAAKYDVRKLLKDPDSARFGEFTLVSDGAAGLACLTVNARNSYGGYTGDQVMILTKYSSGWEGFAMDISHQQCVEIQRKKNGSLQ